MAYAEQGGDAIYTYNRTQTHNLDVVRSQGLPLSYCAPSAVKDTCYPAWHVMWSLSPSLYSAEQPQLNYINLINIPDHIAKLKCDENNMYLHSDGLFNSSLLR